MASMRVFVCHHPADSTFTNQLVVALREAGADVWYDQQSEQMLASEGVPANIDDELRSRPIFCAVLSPAALSSIRIRDTCGRAVWRAQDDHMHLILPIVAAPIGDDEDIWLFLRDFTRIEAPGVQPFPGPEAIQRTLHTLALPATVDVPLPDNRIDRSIALVDRARALAAQQHFSEALADVDQALDLSPRMFQAWAIKAWLHWYQDEGELALTATDRAQELYQHSARVWVCRARALNLLHRPDEALAAVDRALRLRGKDEAAWNAQGEAFFVGERFEEALAAFDHALALAPDYLYAWYGKAYVLTLLNRLDAAAQAYEAISDLLYAGRSLDDS